MLEHGGHEPPQAEDEQPAPEKEKSANLLTDPRFAKLFQDEDFAIDERSREFQLLNPNTKPAPLDPSDGNERKLTAVEEEAIDQVPPSDSDLSSDENEEPEAPAQMPKESSRISSTNYKKSGHRPQQPKMQVSSFRKPQQARDRSFGSRAERSKAVSSRPKATVGEREITFAPEKKSKGRDQKVEKPERRRDKERRSASGNVFRNM